MASVKSIAMLMLSVLLLASATSAARVLRQEEETAETPRMVFLDDGSDVPVGAQPIILDDTPVDVGALMSQSNRKLRTLGLLSGLIRYKLGILQTRGGPRYVLVPTATATATAATTDGASSASSAANAGFQLVEIPAGSFYNGPGIPVGGGFFGRPSLFG